MSTMSNVAVYQFPNVANSPDKGKREFLERGRGGLGKQVKLKKNSIWNLNRNFYYLEIPKCT